MDWNAYRRTYHTYEVSVNQTRILRLVVAEIFQDFPDRLPQDLQVVVSNTAQMWVHLIKKLAALTEEQPEFKPEELQEELYPGDWFHEVHESPLYNPTLSLILAQVMLSTPIFEVDYERLFCHQELIMLFAQIDAFLADTLRVICRVCPQILSRNKTVEWATVLSCGGWEELLDFLVERYVYEFGWAPLPKRLELLREQLGLEVSYSDSDIELLGEAENIRNIVVHNSGRVSQEYIERTKRRGLAVGDYVPLTLDYLEEVSEACRMLVAELFVAVSRKFFEVDESDLRGVWRRSSDLDSNE